MLPPANPTTTIRPFQAMTLSEGMIIPTGSYTLVVTIKLFSALNTLERETNSLTHSLLYPL